MAIPSLSKIWNFRTNLVVPSGINGTVTNRDTLFLIKQELLGLGWIVVKSSNSTSFSDSDLWLSSTNIIWGYSSSNRSWILFNAPLGGQLLIDCTGPSDGAQNRINFSANSLFTGGSLNVQPSAVDEINLLGSGANFLYVDSNARRVVHILQSQDQRNLRIIHMSGTNVYTSLCIETPVSVHSSISGGRIAQAYGWTNHITYANWNKSSSNWKAKHTDNTTLSVVLSCNGTMADGIGERWVTPNLDGLLPMAQVRAIATSPGGYLTRIGTIPDMWFGPTSTAANGDTYSDMSGNPRKFIQLNHIILPWDGTTPEIS